eukprot:c17732_g1_i1.p1 GENE.c17732_g1_i1~~c17732_g1_i1.p1  ORF type:complete len:275 (+),score=48.24 c17732_g1_i1:23-847(+)
MMDWQGHHAGDAEMTHIRDRLRCPDNHVYGLYLSDNSIGDVGAAEIAEGLKSEHCQVTELWLHGNHIGPIGISRIGEAVSTGRCSLRILELCGNSLCDEDMRSVCDFLLNRTSLERLWLTENSIGDIGAQYIATALANGLCRLKELNLYDNRIGDQGAECLARSLRERTCQIEQLVLQKNSITTSGAQHLLNSYFSLETSLTKLSLKENPLPEGFVDIFENMKPNFRKNETALEAALKPLWMPYIARMFVHHNRCDLLKKLLAVVSVRNLITVI